MSEGLMVAEVHLAASYLHWFKTKQKKINFACGSFVLCGSGPDMSGNFLA